jgi:uncharacterized protein (DUF2249 family)
MTTKNTVTVDVREDIRSGREPFLRVMKAVSELQSDEQLLLIAPFQPIPLFHVMERRGFAHRGGVVASGDWEILFTRQTNARPENAIAAITPEPSLVGTASPPAQIMEVDARGLEPPQPLVKILEAVSTLPANAALRALTDRRPLHLYPQLEERGFTAVTEEQTDGSFSTYVSRG